MSTIRLGTASPATQPTTAATLELISQLAQRAAAKKIDILLLPEAFIGGYPRGTSFGSKVGGRSTDGREEYAQYFEKAVDLGDTVGENCAGGGDKWVNRQLPGGEERGDGTREKLEKIANDTGVFFVTGLVEKTGGTLYCSVVYVCPQKGMLGKRRKVMPVSKAPGILSMNASNITDRHRKTLLGPRRCCLPQGGVYRHSWGKNQPGSRHLLGKLHASSPTNFIRPKHQLISCPDSRPARHLAEPHEDRRMRRPLLRRQQQHGCQRQRCTQTASPTAEWS